jgi:hypothetical protein
VIAHCRSRQHFLCAVLMAMVVPPLGREVIQWFNVLAGGKQVTSLPRLEEAEDYRAEAVTFLAEVFCALNTAHERAVVADN